MSSIIIIGLVILLVAVVASVAGVLSNGGSGHPLTHGFAVFGYHVTGSTGTLFLYGILVGAAATRSAPAANGRPAPHVPAVTPAPAE